MNLSLYMPVRLVDGTGCVRSQGPVLLRGLGSRALVVTGGHGARESGALADLSEALNASGIPFSVYDGVTANPTVTQCREAARQARREGADFLVGVGGGSVLDAVKAAALLAGNDTETEEDALFSGTLTAPALPFALIGTTAGTGSEVTAISVLTTSAGRKRSLGDARGYARLAFCDPAYTHSLPRRQTVSTALDALAHTLEGYFHPQIPLFADMAAAQALPRLLAGLEFLAEKEELPDAALRKALFEGAILAGLVINQTGTAFPHPLGYVLTEDYNIPHGLACAAFLPAFLQRAEQYAPQRATQLFALCGGRQRLYGIVNALCDPPVSMTAAQVAAYAARWQQVRNFPRTPGGYSAEDAAALLHRLFVHE